MATRTAESVARAIYDEPRDLLPHEQVFLTAVHQIGMHCARTKGRAIQDWGDGSQAYDATAYMANRKRAEDYAAALAKYDAAVSAKELADA